ncbi:MAG: hypothetical protein ACRDRT_04010 [Pseudonocardiaceae bacterium]
MTTQKVSVTLESDSLTRARQVAGPRGLSGYLDSALLEKLARDERRRAFVAYLDELEESDPTPERLKARATRRAARLRASVSG